jgi:ankyrin repeat protein
MLKASDEETKMKLSEILFGAKCAECRQKIKGEKFPALGPGWLCQTCSDKLDEERRRQAESSPQNQAKPKCQPEAQRHGAEKPKKVEPTIEQVLDGKVLLRFGAFQIAIPAGSPACILCSAPTHFKEKGEGKILIPEEEKGNHPLINKALRCLLAIAAAKCNKCNSIFCWQCVIILGAGSCPTCGTWIQPFPGIEKLASDVLDARQKDEIVRAVLNIRSKGETGERVGEAARQGLIASAWNDVDSYLGQLCAESINSRLNKGDLSEADLQSHLGLNLHGAAKAGDLEQIKKLLTGDETGKGVDVNAKNPDGVTALHLAATQGHRSVAELLLSKGADVNSKVSGDDAFTPLHFAAIYGKQDMVNLLLSEGADVDAKTNNDTTPLHSAAYCGWLEVTKLLLTNGADVNAKERSDLTVLHNAVTAGHLEIVKLLLENGADIHAKYKEQATALDFAVAKGHLEIEALLSQYLDQDQSGITTVQVVVIPKGHVMKEPWDADWDEFEEQAWEDELKEVAMTLFDWGKPLGIKFSPEIARWSAPMLFTGTPVMPVRFNAKFDRETVIKHLREIVSPLDVKDILINGRSWDD